MTKMKSSMSLETDLLRIVSNYSYLLQCRVTTTDTFSMTKYLKVKKRP